MIEDTSPAGIATQQTVVEPQPSNTARSAFLLAVDEAFRKAGAEFVFLHGFDSSLTRDSDIDVAVTRSSLDAVGALIRIGTFGRLLQQLQYDVPWCRYYVLEGQQHDRRYRQLDIACDPWGIGRYGKALQYALQHPVRQNGITVPNPGAHVAYLAAKRARKHLRGSDDRAVLVHAFEVDPPGSINALVQCFGEAGRALGQSLASDGEGLAPALRAVEAEMNRQRRRPNAMMRYVAYSADRVRRRVTRPTGLSVALVGPDGTGKSTLAGALEHAAAGTFRRVTRLHLRPELLPSPASLLGRSSGMDLPHTREPSGRVGSLARLGYFWADTVAGWPSAIGIPRIRSTLVIMERGWSDIQVDPIRYRLSISPRLARALGSVTPNYDLSLVLNAPADVVHARKPELPRSEIERQLDIWDTLGAAAPARYGVVDASHDAPNALEDALDQIAGHLAGRQGGLESAALAFRCLGGPTRTGIEYSVVATHNDPRWILQTGRGARGPYGEGIYWPATARHVPGMLALEAARRLGLGGGVARARAQPQRGVAPTLAQALGVDRVELAATITGGGHRGNRALLTARSDGRIVALAKVARGDGNETLRRESEALSALRDASLAVITVPEVLAFFEWEGSQVLAFRPLPKRGWSTRPLEPVDLDALVDLHGVDPAVLGMAAPAGHVVVHGDFAPWNTSLLRDGHLGLWDWEDVRTGLPLEDLFHWQMQRLVLMNCGTPDEIAASALELSGPVGVLTSRLGLDDGAAARALDAYICSSLATLPDQPFDPAVRLRRHTLRTLRGS